MQIVYLDTSFLLSYLLEGKKTFVSLKEKCHFISSKLILSETASALARYDLLPSDWTEASWNYCSIINDNTHLQRHHQKILSCGFVRGADLHHLSLAEDFYDGLDEKCIATLDKAQAEVAEALGYSVLS
jgi:hypothetical protein